MFRSKITNDLFIFRLNIMCLMNINLHEFDIPVEKNEGLININNLHQSVRSSWESRIRKDINHIKESKKYSFVGEITFNKNIRISGDLLSPLLEDGWSYFDHNGSKLFLSPIKYNPTKDKFYMKNRSDNIKNSEEIITDLNIDLDIKEESQHNVSKIREIESVVTDTWDTDILSRIDSIYNPTNEQDIYCIYFDTNIDLDDNNLYKVPTKKYINGLLQNNWGVVSIKQKSLFIAEIEKIISENKNFGIKVRNNMNNKKPNQCDLCSNNEAIDKYILRIDNNSDKDKETVFRYLCDKCRKRYDDMEI